MKITLCGSIAFYSEMQELQQELIALHHDVQIPELAKELPPEYGGERKLNFQQYIEENGGMDAFPVGHALWQMKHDAINDHFRKIAWSDAILVVNQEKKGIAGYIGGNTLIEMGVAFYLNKKIFVMNEVSSEISYKQEILGMYPIVIGTDLGLIR